MRIDMKKIFLTFIFASICCMAIAQIQLSTKKYVLSDFCEKTLNVVLIGEDMSDAIIRSEMPNIWTISAYEFCSTSDFEKRKKSPEWYFLTLADSKFHGEQTAGIKSLCIFKGCPDAKEGITGLYKVVSIPYCSAEYADGNQTSYLGPLLNILQNEVLKMMDRTVNLSSGVTVKSSNSLSRIKKKVIIDQNYIQEELTPSKIADYNRSGLKINPQNDSGVKISLRDPDYVVGYSVYPTEAVKGSMCFTMLIDASTMELCYFKKSKMKAGAKGGFTDKELRRFSSLSSK